MHMHIMYMHIKKREYMKQRGLNSHLYRVDVLNVEIFVITVEESLLQEINGYKITENSSLKTRPTKRIISSK